MAEVGLVGGGGKGSQPRIGNALGFHLVVEHGRRPVCRHTGQLVFHFGGERLHDRAADAVPAGDGRAHVVGVVVQAAVHQAPALFLRAVLRQDKGGGTFADVQAEPLDVEGPAFHGRQCLEGVEASQDKGRYHIHAADDGRITYAGADEPLGEHLGRSAGDAGVAGDEGLGHEAQAAGDFPRRFAGRQEGSVLFRGVGQFFNIGRGSTQDKDRAVGSGVHGSLSQGVADGADGQGFEPAETFQPEVFPPLFREHPHAEPSRNAERAVNGLQAGLVPLDRGVVFRSRQAQGGGNIGRRYPCHLRPICCFHSS